MVVVAEDKPKEKEVAIKLASRKEGTKASRMANPRANRKANKEERKKAMLARVSAKFATATGVGAEIAHSEFNK